MEIARYSCRLGSSRVASDAELEEDRQQMTEVCPGLEDEMLAEEGASVE